MAFLTLLQDSIRKFWNQTALSDYKGDDFTYEDIAIIVRHYHKIFKENGIKRGDRISICGPNCARWGIAYLSAVTYGAVAVPILNDFMIDQVQNIVNHSESRLLFAAQNIRGKLDVEQIPLVKKVLHIEDIHALKDETMQPEEVVYQPEDGPDALATLNYTSGTTGFSKGVMLPYRCCYSNWQFHRRVYRRVMKPNAELLTVLPMAHMYGLTCSFVAPFIQGCHNTFLTRVPSPAIINQAFVELKPVLLISVPLVIEKYVKYKIEPDISSLKKLHYIHYPIVGPIFKYLVRRRAIKYFGGNMTEVLVGGSAINKSVEEFLKNINFPLAVGYGATETGPMITYENHKKIRKGSCGRAVVNMEVKIDSPKPHEVAGEILTRGKNVMLGYYKNPSATAEAIDEEGWYHTGDLGIIDKDGFVYIMGRKKNMILGTNGQNIYPEEIEDRLNNMDYVAESIIVQRDERLVALIYPNYEAAYANGLNDEQIMEQMHTNRKELNATLPNYSQIARVELMDQEFEKTAKRSIKRFLYK